MKKIVVGLGAGSLVIAGLVTLRFWPTKPYDLKRQAKIHEIQLSCNESDLPDSQPPSRRELASMVACIDKRIANNVHKQEVLEAQSAEVRADAKKLLATKRLLTDMLEDTYRRTYPYEP